MVGQHPGARPAYLLRPPDCGRQDHRLVGTYLVLVQVVLMARLPWLDRWIGTDRMAAWHRANGQYTIGMLVAHTGPIIWGYSGSDRTSLVHESGKLLRSYPDVLAATVALGVLVTVAITSVRAARRRLRYETWYFIHLYGRRCSCSRSGCLVSIELRCRSETRCVTSCGSPPSESKVPTPCRCT
jgi:hypothetical protein